MFGSSFRLFGPLGPSWLRAMPPGNRKSQRHKGQSVLGGLIVRVAFGNFGVRSFGMGIRWRYAKEEICEIMRNEGFVRGQIRNLAEAEKLDTVIRKNLEVFGDEE